VNIAAKARAEPHNAFANRILPNVTTAIGSSRRGGSIKSNCGVFRRNSSSIAADITGVGAACQSGSGLLGRNQADEANRAHSFA
jgi:hypothetical protein